MTRTHRHPVAALLSGATLGTLGTLAAARIVREVAAPQRGVVGLAAMSPVERADEISTLWRAQFGRSIHQDEARVLVVERDRRGRVVRHQVEGVAA